jgi:SAM-dependent methyltransferase
MIAPKFRPSDEASPFLRRPYGAYTKAQLDCICELYDSRPQSLLDPMCGTGWSLPHLLNRDHDVTGIDINPPAAAFAELRSPELSLQTTRIEESLEKVLRACPSGEAPSPSSYESGWLPASVQRWLQSYGSAVRRSTRVEKSFGHHLERVLLFLPMLAARALSTYSTSDNVTWMKPGGMRRLVDPADEIRKAFASWASYISQQYPHPTAGRLTIVAADFCSIPVRQQFGRCLLLSTLCEST